MRYLVLSDVHANLEALEAVLTDADPYDASLCLGDLVGYGPDPNECVQRIWQLPQLTCLVGNHDLAALGKLDLASFNFVAARAARWTAGELEGEVREYLEDLSPSLVGPGCFLAHASPENPVWEYLQSAAQGPHNFAAFSEPLCFVGHTHVPRVFTEAPSGRRGVTVATAHEGDVLDLTAESRRIVNPGGVGQPRDGDPRAAYGLWDTEVGRFEFRRVEYPVAVTQQKILQAGLPSSLADRLSLGR